jgi:hypothetical protein
MARQRGERLKRYTTLPTDLAHDVFWDISDRSVCQIIYTAIVGFLMLAAILEWFLWIAAFMYCLVKVFQKAEHWTVRILAIIVGTAFCLLRYQTGSRACLFNSSWMLTYYQVDLLAHHDRHTALTQPSCKILA